MHSDESRLATAVKITTTAASKALSLFQDRDSLLIEQKGLQDWVSNADKSVEDQIRSSLNEVFPDDAIIGEEHANQTGVSGYTWVIDPIDGTTNFLNGTPGWCVVLACIDSDGVVCAVVCDPLCGETFTARKNGGAMLNGKPIRVSETASLSDGTLGVGHSTRVSPDLTIKALGALLQAGGLFRRGGSGALDLAYVAAGRLIGFVEPHMNAWDCLASLLIIEEAGGLVEPFDLQEMVKNGGRVTTACPGVYEAVLKLNVVAID